MRAPLPPSDFRRGDGLRRTRAPIADATPSGTIDVDPGYLASHRGITVAQAAKDAGVEILGFVRMAVGEGIEKEKEDFAAEVAKALKG
mgnify:CR=1 FL=1